MLLIITCKDTVTAHGCGCADGHRLHRESFFWHLEPQWESNLQPQPHVTMQTFHLRWPAKAGQTMLLFMVFL